MATLHLMVGLPCSGKTTLAQKLEQERSALRLTPDAWQVGLSSRPYRQGDTLAIFQPLRSLVHAHNGRDSVLMRGPAFRYQPVSDRGPCAPG